MSANWRPFLSWLQGFDTLKPEQRDISYALSWIEIVVFQISLNFVLEGDWHDVSSGSGNNGSEPASG